MASNTRNSLLVDYKGSKEEAIIKRVLGVIASDSPPQALPTSGFYNLVIRTSNAGQGTSFSDASVYLRLIDEFRDAVRTHFECGLPKCEMVFLRDILDVSVLREFLVDGVAAVERQTDLTQNAFLTLIEFLHDKRKHGNSIKKLITKIPINGSKETNVMVALAHHLFSQLVPGKKYEVDKYAKQIPRECGCGCKARICEGNTVVGSQGTWHGRVDILLNGVIAVAVKENQNSLDEEKDDENGDEAQPARKKRKLGEYDICVEVKSTKKNDCVLLDEKVLSQIIAESITNGFAQVNMNRDTLAHFLIPTFGATSGHVSVSLYDSENDYLLHIKDVLELWYPDEEDLLGELNNTTIVIIWLFLNFTLFTKKRVCATIDLNKSGLHEELKDRLDYYKKIKTRGNVVSQTNFASVWKLFEPTAKRPKEHHQE